MNTWIYISNTFEVITRNSYKLCDILLRDHVARATKKLANNPGDTALQIIQGEAASELSLWASAHLSWTLARGTYRGATQTVEELLTGIAGRLDEWIVEIQAAGVGKPYMEGKPGYTVLFPEGRQALTRGAYEQRILKLTALGAALTAQAPLAAVATQVNTYAGTLAAARSTQQGAEGNVEDLSDALEVRRKAACLAMYRNLGRAMTKYGPEPVVETFFDMSYIRDGAAPPPDNAPPAPLDLTVTPDTGTPGNGDAAWGAAPGADGYNFYRRPLGETVWTLAGTTAAATLALTGQPVGPVLEYAVAAFNAAGEGPKSAPVEVTF